MLAVILAGGQATRMGGGDKLLLEIGGRRLIDLILDRLDPAAGSILLNANGAPERFRELDLPVVADRIGGHVGPLAGVEAAMASAVECGAGHVLSLAGDTPFYPRDLGERLAAGPADEIAVAATRDATGKLWPQPTFALWPVALRPELAKALDEGTRKIMHFVRAHPHRLVEFEPAEAFFNINRPEDLAIAEDMLAAGQVA